MGFGGANAAWVYPSATAGGAAAAARSAAPAAALTSCWAQVGGLEWTAPCSSMAVEQAQPAACGTGQWSLANPLTTDIPRGALKLKKCGSWSPLVALGQTVDGACWPGEPTPPEPRWRQRSLTPDDATQVITDDGPITPTAAPSHAAASPLAASSLAAAGQEAACGTAPAVAARRASAAAALWRRIHSFMRCVAGSPLVQSALLSLELGGTHPARAEAGVPDAAGLDWTLAQLLALHIKAGVSEATEHSLLASLWLLESVESVWRSPATVCLNDYLKHLAVFSPEAVVAITADWKASFQQLRAGVVAMQMDLLTRLDWRVRLDAASEVQPCRVLLFRAAGGGAGARPSLRNSWASHMRLLVQHVQHKAVLLNKHGRLASKAEPECSSPECQHLTPTKRQRTHA